VGKPGGLQLLHNPDRRRFGTDETKHGLCHMVLLSGQ
jgi:hypothetical protein